MGVIFEGGSKLVGNFWRWVQNLGFNRLADFFGPTSKNDPQVMDPPPKITPELWTHASIFYHSLVSKEQLEDDIKSTFIDIFEQFDICCHGQGVKL